MITERLNVSDIERDKINIDRAAEILKNGGIVAGFRRFPLSGRNDPPR